MNIYLQITMLVLAYILAWIGGYFTGRAKGWDDRIQYEKDKDMY